MDRSVGDIIREMDAIDRRGYEIETAEDDVQLRSDYKSPRSPHWSPRSPGRWKVTGYPGTPNRFMSQKLLTFFYAICNPTQLASLNIILFCHQMLVCIFFVLYYGASK